MSCRTRKSSDPSLRPWISASDYTHMVHANQFPFHFRRPGHLPLNISAESERLHHNFPIRTPKWSTLIIYSSSVPMTIHQSSQLPSYRQHSEWLKSWTPKSPTSIRTLTLKFLPGYLDIFGSLNSMPLYSHFIINTSIYSEQDDITTS